MVSLNHIDGKDCACMRSPQLRPDTLAMTVQVEYHRRDRPPLQRNNRHTPVTWMTTITTEATFVSKACMMYVFLQSTNKLILFLTPAALPQGKVCSIRYNKSGVYIITVIFIMKTKETNGWKANKETPLFSSGNLSHPQWEHDRFCFTFSTLHNCSTCNNFYSRLREESLKQTKFTGKMCSNQAIVITLHATFNNRWTIKS